MDAFAYADDLGPAKIIQVCEPRCGLKGTVVIDNVACGPAIGGMRMAPDVTTEECIRLARAMTLKNAMAGLAHGGGKSVVRADPHMAPGRKESLIRTFAHALRHESDYIFGPDMGTDETCMAWVHDEIGRAAGLPEVLGGLPLDELGATGWGLASAARAAAPRCGFELGRARVAVQGFGAVGKHVARFLAELGCVLVAVSDTHGTLIDSQGIDVTQLVRLKDEGGSVLDYPTGEKRDAQAIVDVPCEIWIPAARPDVIHAKNVTRLDTRLMLQGANIPCTAEAEHALHQRGVVVVPDFVANAGGVICAALEYHGATQSAAFAAIAEKVEANTAVTLDQARIQQITPRAAAATVAQGRVRQAMATRRFNVRFDVH